jgi:hypothetical protein
LNDRPLGYVVVAYECHRGYTGPVSSDLCSRVPRRGVGACDEVLLDNPFLLPRSDNEGNPPVPPPKPDRGARRAPSSRRSPVAW